jgi:SNF2 family DNA or RNA helicase
MLMVSQAHKALVIPFRADVANLIPHSKPFDINGQRHLAVPHGTNETMLLRNLDVPAPAPILSHYDWCSGTPYEVQKRTAAVLTTHPRAHCLNGMGTGKTKAALWSADYLMGEGQINRVLVVSPLSTLTDVWEREIFRTIPHCTARVLHGTRAKRLRLLEEDVDFYIVNHDGVQVIKDALAERSDIDAFILDEAAVYRNNQSKRTKLMRTLAASRKYVWGLTGSPTPNEPTDAYAQARIITPGTLNGLSWTLFRDAVMYKAGPFRWVEKQDAAERVKDILSPSVRFTLDDVTELPDIVYQHKAVPLSPTTQAVYKKLTQEMLVTLKSGEINAMNQGVLLNKLLQVATGWVYNSDGKTVELDPDNPRLDALVEIMEASDRKVLVFVPYTEPMKRVAEHLTKAGFKNETIYGGTTQAERGRIFQQFRVNPELKAIVAHPGTMAHGLTLTEADTIVWYSPTTSLETFEQANARIRRIGQNHRQLIIMLGGTDVERKVYRTLERKQKFLNNLLEMIEQDTSEAY